MGVGGVFGWATMILFGLAALPAAATAQATQQDAADPTATEPGPQQVAAGRATGRRSYERAYFDQYQPATALQIAQRVPGFALEEVRPDVRGFANAGGNVVINGQRPSAKTDTLETILARIPASRVLRVEVAPGDLFGSDYTGKSQVLNLILTAAGGLSTTLEGTYRRDFAGQLQAYGSVSTLVRRGPSTFTAAITTDNDATTEEGYDRVTALPGGAETEFRRKVNDFTAPTGKIAGSWEYNGGTNRTAHVNASAGRERSLLTQHNDVFPALGPVRDDRLTQRYRTTSYELGGDVTRPFAGGGLKLLGLATRQRRANASVSLLRVRSAVIGGATQDLNDALDETLARVSWNRVVNGWSIDAGIEGVINRLRSDTALFSLLPGGARVRVDLPVDQATVLERRGEAYLTAGRALSPSLRLDLTLSGETSYLTVRGDTEAERALSFVKPKLVLDYHPAKWRAQLTLQRTVAQLQFEDFVSSAELTNERVNGGNPNLVPQRAWESLLTLEHPILGDGLARLELGFQSISQVQDRVPTPEGFDAPGNLGTGRSYIARGRVEAPLRDFGIKGGRLRLYGSYVGTAVRDPYTRRLRRFSGSSDFVGEAEFRQDLGRFAYGLSFNYQTPVTFYRLDETDQNVDGFPYLSGFVEWRPRADMVVTLNVDNLADVAATRTRDFYTPNRTALLPDAREFRLRNQHLIPMLTLKRTFG